MVRRAAPLLSRGSGAALVGLTAALAAYTAGAGHLWDGGLWPDVLFLTLVLFPATLALIWLALPLAARRGLLVTGLGLAALSVLLRLAELDVLFNLAKLFALIALGFWFLSYFETVAWAVLVAAIIPWVDAVSVWRGPTDYVVEEQPQIFDNVSIAFRVPGGEGTANLGPPDILFFALFLAAAARFGLRVAWTWIGMTALLGATLVLTATTDVSGLPALPAICIGFLLPNADLLWRALRPKSTPQPSETPFLQALKATSIVAAYLVAALLMALLANVVTGSLLVAYVAIALVSVITGAILHPRAFPPGARNERRWLVICLLFGLIAVTWLAWLSITRDRWHGTASPK